MRLQPNMTVQSRTGKGHNNRGAVSLIEMDMNFTLNKGGSLMHSDIKGKIPLYSIYEI